MITDDQKEILTFKIEDEGFDYALRVYSSWKQIQDDEFHKLREVYIKAAKEFQDYLKNILNINQI